MFAGLLLLLFLLLLLRGIRATASECDARQDGVLCHGVAGGSLYLRLSDPGSTRRIRFVKDPNGDNIELLNVKSGIVQILGPLHDRSAFHLANVTLVINNLTTSDSADYVFSNFQRLRHIDHTVHLAVVAPVSPPLLSSECLSTGETRLSCSSEGDGVRYNWTLDGQAAGEDSPTLALQRGRSARVTCSVQNQVSSAQVTEDIFTCRGIVGFVAVWLTEATALGAMWLAFLHLYRRKQQRHASPLQGCSTA